MRRKLLADSLVIITALLFSVLFWQEKMGLNILLLSTLLVGGTLWLKPDIRTDQGVQLTAFSTLVTAICVVWHNSLWSKFFFVVSLMVFIGFSQQRTLRFLWFGGLLAVISALETPLKLFRKLQEQIGNVKWLAPFRFIKVAIIPLLIFLVFFGIYYLANADFAKLVDVFSERWSSLWQIKIFVPRVNLFLFGLVIASAVFWASGFEKLALWQNQFSLFVERKRPHLTWLSYPKSMLGLKNEYRQAMLLIIALNVLLLLVNGMDIWNVWLNLEEKTASELSSAVHEGTFLLIFSILLAMLVLIYYFRGNLNFFPNNKPLQKVAYLWVAQNTILAISLLIRNVRYINDYGLAYYRIGVLIFLTLVFIGLATMALKIWQKRSLYFLVHVNSWAAYLLFVVLCSINWDVAITRYNLQHTQENGLDTYFLMHTVSDKNLFLLTENKEQLGSTYDSDIERKWEHFLTKQEGYSWLSWNYADWRNWQYYQE